MVVYLIDPLLSKLNLVSTISPAPSSVSNTEVVFVFFFNYSFIEI